jgi:xanthine dehydrogenase/oxidase
MQVSNGTWDYHPPTALDIPIYFKTTLQQRPAVDKVTVLGSKASGETAQLLGVGAFFAVKQAIKAARQEAVGSEPWFRLDAPATPEKVQLACLAKLE